MKKTIPERVEEFLRAKEVALQKSQICRQMGGLKKSSVDRACTILRRDKKVGYFRSRFGGSQIVKTYWGIK